MVLAGSLATALTGCASTGGAGDATAVIGLRIEDTPALQAVRSSYHWTVPLWSFTSRDPTATLSFGLIDQATGDIDLPMFATLQGVKARIETRGYATAFTTVTLAAGRYATMQANFLERPDSSYRLVRVLEFSGRSSNSAKAEEVDGYTFTLFPGETVYVGTVVLSLTQLASGKYSYARPRVVDEFAGAAATNPVLARLGADRGTRLMTPVRGRPLPAPQPAPSRSAPPAATPSPAPVVPTQPAPSDQPTIPFVPRIG